MAAGCTVTLEWSLHLRAAVLPTLGGPFPGLPLRSCGGAVGAALEQLLGRTASLTATSLGSCRPCTRPWAKRNLRNEFCSTGRDKFKELLL